MRNIVLFIVSISIFFELYAARITRICCSFRCFSSNSTFSAGDTCRGIGVEGFDCDFGGDPRGDFPFYGAGVVEGRGSNRGDYLLFFGTSINRGSIYFICIMWFSFEVIRSFASFSRCNLLKFTTGAGGDCLGDFFECEFYPPSMCLFDPGCCCCCYWCCYCWNVR